MVNFSLVPTWTIYPISTVLRPRCNALLRGFEVQKKWSCSLPLTHAFPDVPQPHVAAVRAGKRVIALPPPLHVRHRSHREQRRRGPSFRRPSVPDLDEPIRRPRSQQVRVVPLAPTSVDQAPEGEGGKIKCTFLNRFQSSVEKCEEHAFLIMRTWSDPRETLAEVARRKTR